MDDLEKLFSLKNKTIIVTGAARGNGKIISIALSKLGANLIICDCLSAELDKTYKQIKNINTKVDKYNFDLRKINEIKSFVNSLKNKNTKIDVLINNAGVSFPSKSIEYPLELWEQTYQVNIRAPFYLSTRLVGLMKTSKNPSIINITSLLAVQGFPENISYVSFKGALKQMTKSLAYDLSKYHIRVNNICPGYIKTDMTKKSQKNKTLSNQRINNTLLKRWGQSSDLIGAIVYFSSNASKYVTGADLAVDGGWLAKGI